MPPIVLHGYFIIGNIGESVEEMLQIARSRARSD